MSAMQQSLLLLVKQQDAELKPFTHQMCAEQTTTENAFRKSSNQNSSHHSHGDNDLRPKHEKMNLRKTFDVTLQRFCVPPPLTKWGYGGRVSHPHRRVETAPRSAPDTF